MDGFNLGGGDPNSQRERLADALDGALKRIGSLERRLDEALEVPPPEEKTKSELEDELDTYDVDLADLEGSGSGGSIVKDDLVAAVEKGREGLTGEELLAAL